MRRTYPAALAAAALLLALAGCAPGGPDRTDPSDPAAGTTPPPGGPGTPEPTEPTEPAEPTEPTVILTPEPGPTPATPPVEVGAAVEDAVADLAARLGVDASTVTVVRDVAVTWRDGSLGCPVPGMAYTQALTPGRLVVLEVDGRTAEYHSGGRRGLFWCERPEPPAQTDADR
ncbi:hypothetical protein [Actinotalea ferrariae]|nr:hypothetical protein [Actinotalea ferrariae]